ncbi:putative holin-like toxin [Alkalicoccobacillus gibsonii]|uniref:putative holin-like toxin n=1 Tax=Alkalicoccobacillus gibsonii TaxID=79881 RepID=UPI003CCD12D4
MLFNQKSSSPSENGTKVIYFSTPHLCILTLADLFIRGWQHLFIKGVRPYMTVYEALSTMIGFSMLVLAILSFRNEK